MAQGIDRAARAETGAGAPPQRLRGRLKLLAVLPFYWGGNTLLRGVVFVITRWQVQGREQVPRHGPAVLVSNHISYADPPLLALAVGRRRVQFMAKREIFRLPWGIVPWLYGAFPVRRFGGDAAALLKGERILRAGHLVGMFPEGTRARGGVARMHHGAAMLALRTGAPVLPCAIAGTERLNRAVNFFKRPRLRVAIGELIAVDPVERPTPEQLETLTATIHAAVARLYAEIAEARSDVAAGPGSSPW